MSGSKIPPTTTNIVPICGVSGISALANTTIGAYLLAYKLPVIDPAIVCCDTSSAFEDVFEDIFKTANAPFNLTLNEGGFGNTLTNVKLLAVGQGLIKVQQTPITSTSRVYIISICSVENVYFTPAP